MATRSASTELLATPADVWAFLEEPRHLSDWWPNIAFVEPDRLGLSQGARWRVRFGGATWLRRADADDTLLVQAAERERRFAFELVRARLRAELVLIPAGTGRTRADLAASGSLLGGFTRSLPRDALARLHALVQTTDAL